jgi:hypothetical protein
MKCANATQFNRESGGAQWSVCGSLHPTEIWLEMIFDRGQRARGTARPRCTPQRNSEPGNPVLHKARTSIRTLFSTEITPVIPANCLSEPR